MRYFCDCCDTQIFETDRSCPSCGSPIKRALKSPKAEVAHIPDIIPQLSLCGWSMQGFVQMMQKVSAYNGGATPSAICSRECFFQIAPPRSSLCYELPHRELPYPLVTMLAGYEIFFSEDIADFFGSKNNHTMYCVCCNNNHEPAPFVGIIEC